MTDHPKDGPLERVGGYRVVRRIATGGTSDVLLARAEGPHGFGRTVVLKRLLSEYQRDPAFERMFAREASAYARLSHPAIVKLYDFFSVDGRLTMVLEFIDGMPLNRLRASLRGIGHALDDRASIHVCARIFAALAAAHNARDVDTGEYAPVIHRDVNPSNVLVPWDGHVKLADFGIAKLAGVPSDTQVGLIKGTYGYMAPEQVKGEGVTVRVDVYAGALVLWELLARRKAIQRGALPEMEVLRAMAEPSLVSLDVLRPDVDKSVRDAVRRGLEVQQDRRNITADEFLNVLKAVVPSELGRLALCEAMALVRPIPASDIMAPTESKPSVVETTPDGRPAAAQVLPLRESEFDALARAFVELSPSGRPPPPRPRSAAPTLKESLSPKAPPVAPERLSAAPPTLASSEPPPTRFAPPSAASFGDAAKPTTLRFGSGVPGPAFAPPVLAGPPEARPGDEPVPPASEPTQTLGFPSSLVGASPRGPNLPSKTQPMRTHEPPAPAAMGGREPPPLPPSNDAAAAPLAPPQMLYGRPAGSSPPYPSQAPSSQAPGSPRAGQPSLPILPDTRPERRSRALLVGALVLLALSLSTAGLLLWARHRRQIATVPSPSTATGKAKAPASVTASAPATAKPTASAPATAKPTTSAPATAPATASATASVAVPASATTTAPPLASAAAPASDLGDLKTSEAPSGRRIFVDGKVAGQTPETVHVKCGAHVVKVGSAGKEQSVEVPCGGELSVK